jgi:hypothetical protein
MSKEDLGKKDLLLVIKDLQHLLKGLENLQEKIGREELARIKRQVHHGVKTKHKVRQ